MTHQLAASLIFAAVSAGAWASSWFVPMAASSPKAPTYMILKSFNLCLASTVISITSVLNFSLAATLAVTMGVPLTSASPSQSIATRHAKFALYCILALGWLFAAPHEVSQALRNWEVLRVWFAPFVCIVYTPLVLQAGIVCLLSS